MHDATLTLTPQAGGSVHTHTFDFSGACTYDSWNACPLSETVGGYTLNTAALRDGIYTAELGVTDAAGNETSKQLGAITSRQRPDQHDPAKRSRPRTRNGRLGADRAAGRMVHTQRSRDRQLQLPVGSLRPEGNDCQPIAGASGSSYTLATAEVGHPLRVLVTAADNDGSTSLASATTAAASTQAASAQPTQGALQTLPGPGSATATVQHQQHPDRQDRPQQPGQSHTALQDERDHHHRDNDQRRRRADQRREPRHPRNSGRQRDTQADRAHHDHDNWFIHDPHTRWAITKNHDRLSDIADTYNANATVTETVHAGVQLHITPLRTSPAGTITITGTVPGPIPHDGVLVELLVHYRGAWVPFRTPRTSPTGRFKTRYQFQGASGRFPFRALVPAGQAGFPYGGGYSNTITVRSD